MKRNFSEFSFLLLQPWRHIPSQWHHGFQAIPSNDTVHQKPCKEASGFLRQWRSLDLSRSSCSAELLYMFINSSLNLANNLLLKCPGPGGNLWWKEVRNTTVKDKQLGSPSKTLFFHYSRFPHPARPARPQRNTCWDDSTKHSYAEKQRTNLLLLGFRERALFKLQRHTPRKLGGYTEWAAVLTRVTLLKQRPGSGPLLFLTDPLSNRNLLVSDAH